MSVNISIIIPNWNGRAFLDRCVGAVLQSAAECGQEFECLLIDDASSDNSAVETANKFAQVRLINQSVNQGFGKTVNNAARIAKGQVLVLINNDLIPRPGFIEHLSMPVLQNVDVFGVSGKTVDWENGHPNHVNMRGELHSGKLQLTWSDDVTTTDTLFLQGGSCAIRRDLFLEFGGFHELFAPGYWEDYDISYQAVKAGFRNLYEPAAVGSHLGQGSMIRAHGQERIDFVKERNRQLLLALNLTGDEHKIFWQNMTNYVCTDGPVRFKHRLAILRYLWQNRDAIRRERIRRVSRQKYTDQEVFVRFKGLGSLC